MDPFLTKAVVTDYKWEKENKKTIGQNRSSTVWSEAGMWFLDNHSMRWQILAHPFLLGREPTTQDLKEDVPISW